MVFSGQILIDDVDYYDLLTDELVITAEEGAARIAEFILDPFPGPIDPYLWIGKPVVINYVDGAVQLLFSGIVHTVDYDIDAGTTKFTCSDVLQEVFETVSRAAADALITAGVWSDKIFRSSRDNWEYAQQKMSTYPGSLDKAPDGTLRITPWAAKSTPDYTYTAANIDSGSLKIDQLAERRSIVNSIIITYISVFQALRQREQALSWTAEYPSPGNWFQFLERPFKLPERKSIESALNDWKLKSIEYVDLPPSGVYSYLGNDAIWLLNDYGRAQCQGFSAVVAERWRQDIAVEYQMTVKNQTSIDQHGLLETEQHYTVSHKVKGRDDDFLKFDVYKSPEGLQVYNAINADEWLLSIQGDDSLPQLVALLIAKTKILNSHRQNRISFDCTLNSGLDVDKTVLVNHPKLQAKGKSVQIQHRIHVLEGYAITHCVLAVTLPNAAGQIENVISRALTPYNTNPPDLAPPGTPPAWPLLEQHVGNDDGIPVDDPAWNGWITNYDDSIVPIGEEPIVYDPIRFAVESPALDATDYNAWLNGDWELQVKLIKRAGSYYQRIEFNGQIVAAGDSVQLYNADAAVGSPITVTTTHLDNGYIDIAADASRQDEHSLTYIVDNIYNVAIPQDTLTISK